MQDPTMNLVAYAYAVDREIFLATGIARSAFTPIQRSIMDEMIADSHAKGEPAEKTAASIMRTFFLLTGGTRHEKHREIHSPGQGK